VSLGLLLKDELNGFYRSKVMLLLWVGLPAISIIMFYAQPSGTGIPLSSFAAIVVSAIGGTLSSVMLAVTIMNEKERKVYDLFVIRPIKRWELIVSKFAAVLICVVAAGMIAILLGAAIDAFRLGGLPADLGTQLLDSFMIAVAMIGISSSTSVLIGIASPSILVGVIAVLYGSNQLAAVVILPVLAKVDAVVSLLIGAAAAAVMIVLASFYFERKQL
jgi:ABC-2 type transport system permease protein